MGVARVAFRTSAKTLDRDFGRVLERMAFFLSEGGW